MKREKKLISNVLVFAAGNLGSKMLQFLLIPFYTSVLSTAEYGTVDLIQTGSMLLVPIFSLTIAESVFRYGMDQASDRRDVFSIGIYTVGIGGMLLVLLGLVTSQFINNPVSLWLMISYSICNMLRTVSSQFLRAIGKVKLFSIDNVVQTGTIIGLNLLFLLKINLGIQGYMLGYILGNLGSFLFGVVAGKLWKYLKIRKISNDTIKAMLFFSVPLIPNTICWWISSSSDRLMITAYIGVAENGIYSIAHKIPSIISIVVGIFIQAWQISANEEFEQKDSAEFYGSVFQVMSVLNFMFASVLMLFSKLEISIIAEKSYYSAWEVMLSLIIGTVFFSFAQFWGTIYTANKKTSMAFLTNLIAAIINILVNFLLIPIWGGQGAAIATAFSYFVLWISRVFNTRKIIRIKYDTKRIAISSIILIMQACVQVLEVQLWQMYAVFCLIILFIINFKVVKNLVLSIIRPRCK